MSIIISARVKRKVAGSPIKKSILKELADYASDDGSGIWASKINMAQDLEVTKRTIIRAINQFVEDGLLVEVGRKPCSSGYTVEYKIDLDILDSLPDTREAAPKSVNPKEITIIKVKETKVSNKKRSCQIPKGWVANTRNIEDALNKNFTHKEIEIEQEAFRNYHGSKGTTFVDWDMAWRTWIGNAIKFDRISGNKRGMEKPSFLDEIANQAADITRKQQAQREDHFNS